MAVSVPIRKDDRIIVNGAMRT